MPELDTHPYRVKMVRYRNLHGLGPEQPDERGFDPSISLPLGTPGRNLLTREQRHMIARKTPSGKRRLYPHVKESGLLDEPTRAVYDKEFPSRPSFAAAYAQIAHKDDVEDYAEYYTQGRMRWQGVRAVYGKVTVGKPPRLYGGDCSAGYTRWWLWAYQQSTGRIPHDIVNGTNWTGGYTGTIIVVCRKVATPQLGDAIVYFRGSESVHVTGVLDVGARTCISHGKARAEIVGWDNHPGRGGFWRPVMANA
jgi:hypothetical protein